MDGQRLFVIGRYQAIPRPMKGIVSRSVADDRALLELEDGTNVYLEAIDSPKSQRRPKELRRFGEKRVRVFGIVHSIMPSRGQGLLAPCLSDVAEIVEDEGSIADGNPVRRRHR
jgi:hypothetical protein